MGRAKAHTPPSLSLPSSSAPFPLFISLSPCLSFSGCPNEMWASCRTMKWGSWGCFSPCLSPSVLHLTLCFNANSSFISSALLTCATWQGSLCNLPVTMATGAHQSEPWRGFIACLFDWLCCVYLPCLLNSVAVTPS